METLVCIDKNSTNSIILSKSKFIACSFVVYTENDIVKILNTLKNQYQDATHICYAYSIYPSIEKSFDDGEPQGTAGKPILECIKKGGYKNVFVAVIRYFGGIKLGAGGLFRAYSQSASSVLSISGQKTVTKCIKLSFNILLQQSKYLPAIQCSQFVKKCDVIYSENISLTAFVDESKVSFFKQNVNNILSQNIEFLEDENYYFM